MRKIDKIIIHCSATKEGVNFKKRDIERWHRLRGFPYTGGSYCGYHYVIDLDGTIEVGKNMEVKGCHCRGHNGESIGICYIGGIGWGNTSKNTLTDAQRQSLKNLVALLTATFPQAKVYGHRDFCKTKACPCFEVRDMFPKEICGIVC